MSAVFAGQRFAVVGLGRNGLPVARALLGFGGKEADKTGSGAGRLRSLLATGGLAPADLAGRQAAPAQTVIAAGAGRRMAGVEHGHHLHLARGQRIDGAPQFGAADAAIEPF